MKKNKEEIEEGRTESQVIGALRHLEPHSFLDCRALQSQIVWKQRILGFAPSRKRKQLDSWQRNVWALEGCGCRKQHCCGTTCRIENTFQASASALEDFGSSHWLLIQFPSGSGPTAIARSDFLSTLSSPSWEHKIRKEKLEEKIKT